jgi:predicted nucleic-acid-binding Zn-ribbon protein
MLCPECEGNMLISSSPFTKKVEGEKKQFVTYICESCGFTEDYTAKSIKRNKKHDI